MLTQAATRDSTRARASASAEARSGSVVSTRIASAAKEFSMRYVVLGIVLAFPVADLYTTMRVAAWTGIPVWLWLTCSTLLGFSLLRSERTAFRNATVAAMHGEQSLLRGLVDSGRKVL